MKYYNPEYNSDGTEKHVVQDGARFHVLWWDENGEHCTEPNCERNKRHAIYVKKFPFGKETQNGR